MTDLKIEAGKCYETRNGRKAYPSFRDASHVWRGLVVGVDAKGREEVTVGAWTADGHDWEKPGTARNLISEWKEPRKGEVWVNVYGDGDTSNFSCQEAAVASWNSWKWRGRELLAMLGPIPWTEGQGLTDGEGSE